MDDTALAELVTLLRNIGQKHEQTTVNNIRDLLLFGGERSLQDKESQCRAFASLLRSLMRDKAIQQILQLVREREQLRTVIDVLVEKGKETAYPVSAIAQPIRAKTMRTEQEVQKEFEQLRKTEESKLMLFDDVVKVLESLGCDEKFDVPIADIRVPKF